MRPEYLHKGKRRLINPDGLEERLNAFVAWVLVHNAHFVRQSSRLVLPDVLPFRNKVCEFLPLVGRDNMQLPSFLTKNKAFVNVQNTDNLCFR